MITTWTLQHFKSVGSKITLNMAPLTIFAGANSSGKSTLIQSLLLTAQTLQSLVRSRSITLNGHIVRLGSFDDIVSNTHKSDSILIGFQLVPSIEERRQEITASGWRFSVSFPSSWSRPFTSLDCYYTFSSGNPSMPSDQTLQLQPRLEECRIRVALKALEQQAEEEVLIRRSQKSIHERIAEYHLSDSRLQQADIASLEYEVVKLSGAELPEPRELFTRGMKEPIGASCLHFLPQRIFHVFDVAEARAREIAEAFISLDRPPYREDVDIGPSGPMTPNDKFKELILETLNDFMLDHESLVHTEFRRAIHRLQSEFSVANMRRCYSALESHLRTELTQKLATKRHILWEIAGSSLPSEYSLRSNTFSHFPEQAADNIQDFFTRLVKYLGPLRDEPKPVYPLAGATDPKDVGFRGEHTAAVLDIYRNTQVEYIPSAQFDSGNAEFSSKKGRLLMAVQDWSEYMGIASRVETFDKGKLGHELKVQNTDTNYLYDLTHVGVGVSQVLPILVLSLLAEPGSTLIFEQPELHLNPRVQTRLADFFISMTRLNKQCIIETHSEYLINRLRYLSAISEGDQISNDVMIYFVEKVGGQSTYRPVKINKFGVIEEWPAGFFDENEETAANTLRAGMVKHRKEMGKQND